LSVILWNDGTVPNSPLFKLLHRSLICTTIHHISRYVRHSTEPHSGQQFFLTSNILYSSLLYHITEL